MRWLTAFSLALFVTLSLAAAAAQIRGMAGMHQQSIHVGGVSSVPAGTPTGIHIGGYFPGSSPGIHVGSGFSNPSFGFGRPNFGYHHHHYPRSFGYVVPYGYYPYAYDYGYGNYGPYASDYGDDSPYTGYIGGTFDSSSPYAGNPYPQQYAPQQQYAPPPPVYYSQPPANTAPEAQSQRQPSRRSNSADQFAEPTVLVFRDGHRQEIANYAIMGSTVFVLSGPRARIPIAELDVPATVRVNADKGIEFNVPKRQ
jgi:hypothetical protein